jgi:allantoinase
VHLSSADAVPLLRKAREELPVTVETCPHYLFFSSEEVADGDTRFKCTPPIRENDNRERLWEALGEDVIDFVVSDHSPCPPALKKMTSGDFQEAWGGIASLQLGLSIVWTEARRRRYGIEKMAEWMSRKPALLVGLGDRKGLIAPGYDADFVIWDPGREVVVKGENLFHRHKVTPYEGRILLGNVEATILRGTMIYRGGIIEGHPGGRELLGNVVPERRQAFAAH